MFEILTIGYGGKKPDEFFAELDKLKPCVLVDVRRDPFHAFLGVYTQTHLKKRIKRYVWIQELGNKVKRLPPVLIDEEHGMKRLRAVCKFAEIEGVSRIVLLCAEKDEKRCHRLYVKMVFLHGELRKKISECWSAETSYYDKSWFEQNEVQITKSKGQCYETALLVRDLLGGDILTGKVNGESHYWNRLPDGTELDLTSDQYGGDGFNPIIKGTKARKVNRKHKRYLILKRKYMWRFGWIDDSLDREDEEFIEGAIQRKKKGIRYGGKYKGRGKEKRRLP